ncbi:MAG TPA: four helix bundle protein [Humisphaera sp.]
MTYEQWEAGVPEEIKGDSLWKFTAYRLGLFLSDLVWEDATKLLADKRTKATADQLFRAVGGISSNIAEGYSRGTGKSRAQFYEFALGSVRESRDWYYKGRRVLGEKVTEHRIARCTEIIKLLLTSISNERRTNRRLSAALD